MIKLFQVHMPASVDKPLLDVIHSGYVAQGPKVEEFEHLLAGWLQVPKENLATVNSGTSALVLALRLAGVEGGDIVISTAMTCTATNLAIAQLGAVPIFADVHPITGLIDPETTAELVKHHNAKAIMAVDWGGSAVNTKALMKIARRHRIKLVVDSAHSLGTEHEVEPDFRCYSFQAIKFITTGDGGLVVCKNPNDAERGRRLRWFGIERAGDGTDSRIDQDIEEPGFKFHMNDIAATIGIVQMPYLNDVLTRHLRNADVFNKYLSSYYVKPVGSTWLYTVLLPSERLRDQFKDFMLKKGIQVNQVHKRNDAYAVFKDVRGYETLNGLDLFSSHMICIPVHWALTKSQINYIVKTMNEFAAMVTEGDA